MAVKALIPAVEDLSETLLDARLRWKRLAERKARMVESGGLARDIERDVQIVEEYIREGRFQRSLSLIAGISALLGGLEVTYEHYQGSYSQRIMYSLLVAGDECDDGAAALRAAAPRHWRVSWLDRLIAAP